MSGELSGPGRKIKFKLGLLVMDGVGFQGKEKATVQ